MKFGKLEGGIADAPVYEDKLDSRELHPIRGTGIAVGQSLPKFKNGTRSTRHVTVQLGDGLVDPRILDVYLKGNTLHREVEYLE